MEENSITFHKDPGIVLDFCILQQHPAPCTQILIQANRQTYSTYQTSSEYCIGMPDYLCPAIPLSGTVHHLPSHFSVCQHPLTPNVQALSSNSVIFKFNKHASPLPKPDPVYFGFYMNRAE